MLTPIEAELLEAVKAMQQACEEWATKLTQRKRVMDWEVIIDAYCKADAAIARAENKQRLNSGVLNAQGTGDVTPSNVWLIRPSRAPAIR